MVASLLVDWLEHWEVPSSLRDFQEGKCVSIYRKNLLGTNALAFLVGCLIYIPNFYSFLLLRLIQGICVGIFSILAPLIVR